MKFRPSVLDMMPSVLFDSIRQTDKTKHKTRNKRRKNKREKPQAEQRRRDLCSGPADMLKVSDLLTGADLLTVTKAGNPTN